METFLSVLLGEVVSRSINFFISKSSKQKVPDDHVQDSLQRVLLRAQAIIDEATGRHITNQGMLQQLGMLRDAMYQGNYILDTSIYQSYDVEDGKDSIVSRSLSLCKVNSLRGISSSCTKKEILEQLQHADNNLRSMVLDVKELVVFLTSYPRLYRQPYSMHLLLSNCMFGRQMEAHHVISFLLDTQPRGSEELELLPIVGPYEVGKSTLVSHVCKDERIRDHFSEIFLLRRHEFTNFDHAKMSKGCAAENQNHVLNSNKDRRLLFVVELVGDLNEDTWNKWCCTYKQHIPRGSKIIVTSRSDNIIKFGTAPPLYLKHLSPEAYWYFFKTLTFGSMDPETHPRFAQIAMEMARILSGTFIGANMNACLLRDNFDIQFWHKVVAFNRGVTLKNVSEFGVSPFNLIQQNRPILVWRMATPSEELVSYGQSERSAEEEVPKINYQDVFYGNVKARGKIEILLWRSRILPYYSYVNSSEIQEVKTAAAKRKRSMKIE